MFNKKRLFSEAFPEDHRKQETRKMKKYVHIEYSDPHFKGLLFDPAALAKKKKFKEEIKNMMPAREDLEPY